MPSLPGGRAGPTSRRSSTSPGRPDLVTRLPLADLWSPKAVVVRDGRYIRYTEYPTAVLGTDPPPIEVQPLGLPGQPPLVPLAAVRLV